MLFSITLCGFILSSLLKMKHLLYEHSKVTMKKTGIIE
jgi:hypothetical protein